MVGCVAAEAWGLSVRKHGPHSTHLMRCSLQRVLLPPTPDAQAAGGMSHNGHSSILDLLIEDTSARSIIAVGSGPRVEECLEAMRAGA